MRLRSLFLTVIVLACSPVLAATGFTYQGQLISSGAPATGGFDFQFTLYSAASSGVVVGTPVTATNAAVTNGLFATTLDFGAVVFDGTDRWVEIAVRPTGSGSYTTLSPRQAITPTPYALTGLNNVLRAGDTMTGPLGLPDGGLWVGNNQLVVAPSGRVGIGTATPINALDVQATGGAFISTHDTASIYSYAQGVSGDVWYLGANTTNGGSSVMYFDPQSQTLTHNSTVAIDYGLKVRWMKVAYTTTLDGLQHVVLVDSTNGAVTVTLPPASGMMGRVLTLKHIAGGNAVIIAGNAAETIDGSAGILLTTANITRTLISDGSKWYIIGN